MNNAAYTLGYADNNFIDKKYVVHVCGFACILFNPFILVVNSFAGSAYSKSICQDVIPVLAYGAVLSLCALMQTDLGN